MITTAIFMMMTMAKLMAMMIQTALLGATRALSNVFYT